MRHEQMPFMHYALLMESSKWWTAWSWLTLVENIWLDSGHVFTSQKQDKENSISTTKIVSYICICPSLITVCMIHTIIHSYDSCIIGYKSDNVPRTDPVFEAIHK